MMNNEREKINDDKAIYVLPVIPEELIIKEDNEKFSVEYNK